MRQQQQQQPTADPAALNELISLTESISKQYGLSLNRAKCQTIQINNQQHIKFVDNTRLDSQFEAKYLGCNLNRKADIAREVRDKIAETKKTWLKMQLFWKHNEQDTNNAKWKINVYNAVIRSKLLYGLETAHLTKTQLRKLDAFHLRGLRKILNIATTYINRANTNQQVINRANCAVGYNASDPNCKVKPVVLFSEMLANKRVSLAQHIIRSNNNDPLRQCTYEKDSAKPIEFGKRRVGGPKQHWTYQTNKLMYEKINANVDYDSSDFQNNAIYRLAFNSVTRNIPQSNDSIPNYYLHDSDDGS